VKPWPAATVGQVANRMVTDKALYLYAVVPTTDVRTLSRTFFVHDGFFLI
jgi:hypothetical protein